MTTAATSGSAAVRALIEEHAGIEARLAEPEIHADQALARRLGRRYAELAPVVATAGELDAAEADLADGSARRRFMLFLVQYWGGPGTYSEERGHPRLRMRHAPFTVDETAQEHWLTHFRAALDEVGLTEEQDARLWGYVTYAAQFMRNA